MSKNKKIFFDGKVGTVGNSLCITIPKRCAEYIRIIKGDIIEVKINKR